ncbi:hypothetical protein D083_4367 [Dickeya solani RNS 08.23.3.1.A]|nr:hypothetical protein D083_4367 [Dickeya solani RNS 08.23.3.1.A]
MDSDAPRAVLAGKAWRQIKNARETGHLNFRGYDVINRAGDG